MWPFLRFFMYTSLSQYIDFMFNHVILIQVFLIQMFMVSLMRKLLALFQYLNTNVYLSSDNKPCTWKSVGLILNWKGLPRYPYGSTSATHSDLSNRDHCYTAVNSTRLDAGPTLVSVLPGLSQVVSALADALSPYLTSYHVPLSRTIHFRTRRIQWRLLHRNSVVVFITFIPNDQPFHKKLTKCIPLIFGDTVIPVPQIQLFDSRNNVWRFNDSQCILIFPDYLEMVCRPVNSNPIWFLFEFWVFLLLLRFNFYWLNQWTLTPYGIFMFMYYDNCCMTLSLGSDVSLIFFIFISLYFYVSLIFFIFLALIYIWCVHSYSLIRTFIYFDVCLHLFCNLYSIILILMCNLICFYMSILVCFGKFLHLFWCVFSSIFTFEVILFDFIILN